MSLSSSSPRAHEWVEKMANENTRKTVGQLDAEMLALAIEIVRDANNGRAVVPEIYRDAQERIARAALARTQS